MRLFDNAGKAAQIDEEQRLVDGMYACLDAELSASISAHERALAAPVDGQQDLYARDLEVSRLAETARRLRSAERALCFGRIDDAEHGTSLHVGKLGLRTDAGEALLVDWRAEAARPFYSATMVSPLGLHRRRHLRIDDRTVVDVTDEILDGSMPTPVDVVGDAPLVASLSGARTGRMREAAATLQTEQDAIVRSTHRGITVVDGGPGTGKTIVALHRAAYVLYAFPWTAEQGVLVFGPNRRFLTYISNVLPSLGENDVRLATLVDLIGLEPSTTEPDDVARIKGRAQFADALACWVHAREPHGVPLELHTAHGTVVLDPELVDTARRSAVQGGVGHNSARQRFSERIVEELVTELQQQTAKELSDFETEVKDLLGIDLDRMFAGDTGHVGPDDADASADGMEIDWDLIAEELLDDPGIDSTIDQVWPRLRAEDAVMGLLTDPVALAHAVPDVADEDLKRIIDRAHTGSSVADLALLDEARTLIHGLPETSYGHIVVDEAQQLSEMQWRMLMRRCPQRSMTIVGDLAQAGPTTTIRTWDGALQPFVGGRFVHHTLSVNYRTTAEILQATEPLLSCIAPEQRLSRSIRHGEQPTVISVAEDDIPSALNNLITGARRAHPAELIGVIAAVQRCITLAINEFDATLVAAPDARGLEFDTVILVDPVGIRSANEAGLRDLYVAQSRATKRLFTLDVSPSTTETRLTRKDVPSS